MKIVREAISFKRGDDAYDALNIGTFKKGDLIQAKYELSWGSGINKWSIKDGGWIKKGDLFFILDTDFSAKDVDIDSGYKITSTIDDRYWVFTEDDIYKFFKRANI